MNLHPQSSGLDPGIGRRDGQRLLGGAGGNDGNAYQGPLAGNGASQQVASSFDLLPDEGQLTGDQVRNLFALVVVPTLALEEKGNEIRLYIARYIFHSLLSRFLQQLMRRLGLTFFFKQRGMLAQNSPPLLLDGH
jgi:hypothetical protein